MLPLASKFLPCVTLNWPWRSQSRIVPSLHSVSPAITLSARSFAHMLAFAADHHGDLALVIELFGNFRPDEILPVPDQRIRRAVEQARIFRRLGQVIVPFAVGVVDADAEDFFRRGKRRQQLDLGQRQVGAHAVGGGSGLVERLGAKDVEQGGEAAQPQAQIDDALAGDHAEARPTAQLIAARRISILPGGLSPSARRVRA